MSESREPLPQSSPHERESSDLAGRVARLEDELAEVCQVLNQMTDDHERLARALRQQRWGRVMVWATVIVALLILYLGMRARLIA